MVFPHMGGPELILILVVVLIVFGVGKLPQVGGAIGKGLREFRKGQRGDVNEEAEEEEPSKPKRTVTKKVAKDTTKKEEG